MPLDPKMAACPLLTAYEEVHLCRRASDCGGCVLFAAFVDGLELSGEHALSWACWRCLEGEESTRRARGLLLGFYDSGICTWCGEQCIILNAVLTPKEVSPYTTR